MSAGRGQAEHGRVDRGAGRQQLLAPAASSPGGATRARRGVPLTRPSASRWTPRRGSAPRHPSGTIAPVAISTQVPSPVSGAARAPASTRPTGRHGAGPRTAQPSMLDVGNAGRSVRATSGSASVSPSAPASGTVSAGPAAARPASYASGAGLVPVDREVVCASPGEPMRDMVVAAARAGRRRGQGSGRAPPGRRARRRSSRAG